MLSTSKIVSLLFLMLRSFTWQIWHLEQRSHSFQTWKTTQNLCSSHCLLSKTTFLVLKVSVVFFLGLRQDFTQTCCSFKSANFCLPSSQMEHTLIINETFLNNHMCYSIPSRKLYFRLLFLHPVAEVQASISSSVIHISPETVWSHHIFTVRFLWCSHSLMSMTSPITFFLICFQYSAAYL